MSKTNFTDIVLSSALIATGSKLKEITVEGSRGTFHFEVVDPDFLVKYELGQIRVEPVEFNNAIKRLTTSVRRMTQIR